MRSVNEVLHKLNFNHFENQSQLYLYGDSSINNSDNKEIILSTIKYIKETQRFATYCFASIPSPTPVTPPSVGFNFFFFSFASVCFVLKFSFCLSIIYCKGLGWPGLWLSFFAMPRPMLIIYLEKNPNIKIILKINIFFIKKGLPS